MDQLQALKFDLQGLLRKLIIMLSIFCGVTVVTGGAIWIKIDHQNSEAQKSRVIISNQTGEIQRLNERILSCTDPKGKCYQENTQRTSGIITTVTDAEAAAVACAQEDSVIGEGDPAKRTQVIKDCVKRVLTTR